MGVDVSEQELQDVGGTLRWHRQQLDVVGSIHIVGERTPCEVEVMSLGDAMLVSRAQASTAIVCASLCALVRGHRWRG